MRLYEYMDRESHEPNMFWRLDPGEHLNLLDEAIERIDELEEALEVSKRELSGNPGRLQGSR